MLTLISMLLSVWLQIYIYFNFKNFICVNIKNMLEVINNKKSYGKLKYLELEKELYNEFVEMRKIGKK